MLSKSFYSIVSCLLLFTSCQEDFLEDKLLSNTSVDFLYSTPQGLESAVVGLYSLNRNLYEDLSLNGTYPLIPQAKSDLGVGITGEVSLYSRLLWGASLGDFGTTSGLNAYWVNYYKIVDNFHTAANKEKQKQSIE